MKSHALNYMIFALLLFLLSCSSPGDISGQEEPVTEATMEGAFTLTASQFKSSEMALGTFDSSSFHQVIKAIGKFDVPPENNAAVSSYFPGTIKDIRLLPGEQVRKGQKLFTLENPDFIQIQQDYLEAKGQLSYLKSDYERQKNLVQDKVTSQKNYLKAESDYTVTKVKAASLAKKLALMNIDPNTLTLENIRTTIQISSPISGYVTQVDAMRGQFLESSQTAISIVDTDHMHLELNIFEKDLSKIRKGQNIHFKTQEDNSQSHEAFVYLVNKTVNPEDRTIGIHGHLSDEKLNQRFNPGMYVEAEIYANSTSKLSLPQEALVDIDGKYYVLVLHNFSQDIYSFRKREVKIGLSNDGYVEILNYGDFSENAQFLVKGAFNLITE
ncbi:efflux RND transporter periplasmic adaptor subunit [Cyclobacterium sp. 1_MG-2023]|uniref:efflux RND transporter periplasmic adaptor subunit n=1 Tax=Cyclobacterium sp. 1_MG-2023 TaxID=3062681 RepID=UPI0026E19E89|nr:efflux RND transporter periplasmic adaptor subunit [Cyclobacterium sp. 1_MG-2023]MDO6437194.1 efflux RND transporter periplasmic adaptor subunit [Cyclobacterium sp. 1_MG-2023]